jgi:hypothetical protein
MSPATQSNITLTTARGREVKANRVGTKHPPPPLGKKTSGYSPQEFEFPIHALRHGIWETGQGVKVQRRYHTTHGLTSFAPDSVPAQSRAALRTFAFRASGNGQPRNTAAQPLPGTKLVPTPDALTKVVLPCSLDDPAAPNTGDR